MDAQGGLREGARRWLYRPLDSVGVSIAGPARLLADRRDAAAVSRWSLHDTPLGPALRGAIAVEAIAVEARIRRGVGHWKEVR